MTGWRRTRRMHRGATLVVIAALMIGSAAVRFGIFAAPAIAREAGTSQTGIPAPEQPPTSAAATPVAQTTPAELQQLLSAFQQREQALRIREVEIEDQMKALSVADAAVTRKLSALGEAEKRLKATLALADSAAEGDLGRLTEMYQQMKPKESAALFEQMQPEFAAGFLARMRPEAAAGILAGMNPQSAYAVSVVLAGRNANAPKE
ncbi:MAG: MotE family protein [Jhaorihella sp.]